MLTLAWGQAATELHVYRVGEAWRLRIRRRTGDAWPPVFAATFTSELSDDEAAQLAGGIERSGFFTLPPIIESREHTDSLQLRIRQRGRTHRVLARGRSQPALDRAILAIDGHLPVVLPSPPGWLREAGLARRGRPGLVVDAASAIRFHQVWLAEQPERAALRLDLFALFLSVGKNDRAVEQLRSLQRDPTLKGLVPELRQLLRT